MIPGGCAVFVGCIAHAVLRSQLLDNAGVDLADGFFLRDFKETSTSLFGNPLKNFFTVGSRFFGMTLSSARPPATATAGISTSAPRPASTSTRPTAAAPAHSAASPLAFVTIFAMRIREINGVHDGVGTLGRLDGALQVSLAAAVNAVRENDESFPALLLFH